MNPSDVTLLLTRPARAAERFRNEVETVLGAFGQTVISPLVEIRPLPITEEVAPDALLIFTSENGVAAVSDVGVTGRRAWCVGARTAEVARAAGFDAQAAGGDSAALVSALLEEDPSDEIVHFAGEHHRGDVVESLRAGGLTARRIAVYDQAALSLTSEAGRTLASQRPVLAPIFSPRTARLLSREAREGVVAPLFLAHLSPSVASAWDGADPRASCVAHRPDAQGMIAAMDRLLHGSRAP